MKTSDKSKINKIKVLHIVGGKPYAGAFKGSYILHKALIELNVNSKILSDCSTSIGEKFLGKDNHVIYINDNFLNKVFNLTFILLEKVLKFIFLKRPRSSFTIGIFGLDITKTKEYQNANIIHIHWLSQGFINITSIKKITKPLVWTMRDMWAFTGGPHYTCDFREFEGGKISNFLIRLKKKSYPIKTKFIAISNWLKLEAKKSFVLKNFKIYKIYNNINIENFNFTNKLIARKFLDIDTKKKIILFGAQNPQSIRKGWNIFTDTLKKLDKSEFYLIIFGNFWSHKVLDKIGIQYKSFGFVNDVKLQNMIYSASDCFIFSSLQEAFGKTWAEAMACKVPVICLKNSSAAEFIDHKKNGYVLNKMTSINLKKAIYWVTSQKNQKKSPKFIENKKIKKLRAREIAKKYIKLYSEML